MYRWGDGETHLFHRDGRPVSPLFIIEEEGPITPEMLLYLDQHFTPGDRHHVTWIFTRPYRTDMDDQQKAALEWAIQKAHEGYVYEEALLDTYKQRGKSGLVKSQGDIVDKHASVIASLLSILPQDESDALVNKLGIDLDLARVSFTSDLKLDVPPPDSQKYPSGEEFASWVRERTEAVLQYAHDKGVDKDLLAASLREILPEGINWPDGEPEGDDRVPSYIESIIAFASAPVSAIVARIDALIHVTETLAHDAEGAQTVELPLTDDEGTVLEGEHEGTHADDLPQVNEAPEGTDDQTRLEDSLGDTETEESNPSIIPGTPDGEEGQEPTPAETLEEDTVSGLIKFAASLGLQNEDLKEFSASKKAHFGDSLDKTVTNLYEKLGDFEKVRKGLRIAHERKA